MVRWMRGRWAALRTKNVRCVCVWTVNLILETIENTRLGEGKSVYKITLNDAFGAQLEVYIINIYSFYFVLFYMGSTICDPILDTILLPFYLLLFQFWWFSSLKFCCFWCGVGYFRLFVSHSHTERIQLSSGTRRKSKNSTKRSTSILIL